MTYKPCTAAQYRIMGYLRETFETSLCLIYPSRPNAMVLEDQFGEKLEFFFRDGKILEHSLMPPAVLRLLISSAGAWTSSSPCPVKRRFPHELPSGPPAPFR